MTDTPIDAVDRRIIQATQAGLPLTSRPYHTVATELDLSPEEVIQRMQRMLDAGIIRRIGVIPNHYALGYKANGMTVWNVPDEKISALGKKVGALDFVSHCYHRPRHQPLWDYNLFAMVHATEREGVEALVAEIASVLGEDNHGHTILYSSKILKKTGFRLNGA